MFFVLALRVAVTFKYDGWGHMPVFKVPSRRGILRASQVIDLCQLGAGFDASGACVERVFCACCTFVRRSSRCAHGVDSGALAPAPIARMRRAARHGTRGELLIRCAPYYIHTLRALSFPGGGRAAGAGG